MIYGKKFKSLVIPYKDICIDESLILWKGRLAFKQYIPTKRHRFGIKVFVVCDYQTGVVLDFIVYTGSSTGLRSRSKLGKIRFHSYDFDVIVFEQGTSTFLSITGIPVPVYLKNYMNAEPVHAEL